MKLNCRKNGYWADYKEGVMNGYNSNEFQVDTPEDTPFFFYTNPVVGVDSQEYFEIKLHDLVSQIKDRIDYFIKQMRKNPQIQWYSHKIAVLNATKNYLYDNRALA